MLSLEELQRATRSIDAEFADHRVEKIVQPDEARLVIVLYGRPPAPQDDGPDGQPRSSKRCLLLCCHPELGRVGAALRLPAAPDVHPPFAQMLRARLHGARLRSARAHGDDRMLRLLFEGRDKTGEQQQHTLVLSLAGRRANLFLLGGDERVLAALRPFGKTRPELSPGAVWLDPPARAATSAGGDRFAGAADGFALLQAIEARYGEAQHEREGEELARRIAQALRKERKQAEKRLARVEEELAEAEQASVLQRHGELLKTALGRIEPGQSEVIVEDFENGEEVRIPLDPTKSPKQNLDATFKRYQKLLRRLTKAGGQLDEARERVERLDELERRVGAADGAEALQALAGLDEVAKLLRRHSPPPAEARRAAPEPKGPFAKLPAKLRPRRYRSSDGLEIWVGRTDAGNDHLSTRLARGKDLFFHVESSPGSHVVLRTGGRDDPPSESLLEAAELAVRFSKQKNAPRCDVHVVPIKNVKKPRGAKPGLVMVTGGRSLHLRRDEERLARILAARIPDDEEQRA